MERMKVESNWTKTRYSFICEDEKDKKFLDKMNDYIDDLEEENKKLKETIKDHQLYEEKLEHRIIEFEELLHGE